MDSATISAVAALAGATIGGITSLDASWLSQQTQAKIQARAHKLSQREHQANSLTPEDDTDWR